MEGVFLSHRALLIGVAYRVLGRVGDAEDVVQEAWLRWSSVDGQVADPEAFLVRVTTRLAIDRLRQVRARKESYVGPWLPEPLPTSPDVAELVVGAESVSFAMLTVLESLSPLERAVFVLREVFALPYDEIAETLGRSQAAIRQLARRSRQHIAERRPRFDVDPRAWQQVTDQFLRTCMTGNLDSLLALLAPGVSLVGDGGGHAMAPRRVIIGPTKVARFIFATLRDRRLEPFLASNGLDLAAAFDLAIIHANGGPAAVLTVEGTALAFVQVDVADGLVQTIYLITAREKLARLMSHQVEAVRP
jgi:RNA polymerase sigma-70 factor (ECF subfamily)